MSCRSRIAGAVLAALCTVGVYATSASAVPKTLHLTYEGSKELLVGQTVEANSFYWEIKSSEGNTECQFLTAEPQGLIGKDETNNAKSDAISVEKAFGRWQEEKCSTTVAGFPGSSTGRVINANTGSAAVSGKFTIGKTGKVQYTSGAKGNTVFELEGVGGFYCFWEVKKLKGYNTEAFPGELFVYFPPQKVKLLKEVAVLHQKSILGCPKTPTFATNVNFEARFGAESWAYLEGSVS